MVRPLRRILASPWQRDLAARIGMVVWKECCYEESVAPSLMSPPMNLHFPSLAYTEYHWDSLKNHEDTSLILGLQNHGGKITFFSCITHLTSCIFHRNRAWLSVCLRIIPLIVKNILPRIHLMRKSAYPFWFNPSTSGNIMIDPAPLIVVQWLPYLYLRCSLATLSIKESSHNFLALGGCRSVAHSKWPCFLTQHQPLSPWLIVLLCSLEMVFSCLT